MAHVQAECRLLKIIQGYLNQQQPEGCQSFAGRGQNKWNINSPAENQYQIYPTGGLEEKNFVRPSTDKDAAIACLLQECINGGTPKRPNTRSHNVSVRKMVEERDKDGKDAVGLAAAYGLLESVRVLVESVMGSDRLRAATAALNRAANSGWLDIVEYLLQSDADFKQSFRSFENSVMVAGDAGHPDCYRALLVHHKQISTHDPPIDFEIKQELYMLCEKGHKECVEILLDVYQASSIIDMTAVFNTVWGSSPDTLQLILTKSSEDKLSTIKEKKNISELTYELCRYCRDPVPMLKVLVFEFGFELNWEKLFGCAVQSVQYHFGDKAVLTDLLQYLIDNRQLLGLNLNPDIYRPLNYAVVYQNHKVVEYLLQNGARTDNSFGTYPEYLQERSEGLPSMMLPHTDALGFVVLIFVGGLEGIHTQTSTKYGRNALLCALHILRSGCPVHKDLNKALFYIFHKFELAHQQVNNLSRFLDVPTGGMLCVVVLRMLYVGLYRQKHEFRDTLLAVHKKHGIKLPSGYNRNYFSSESAVQDRNKEDCMGRWGEFFKPCSLQQVARDCIRGELESGILAKVKQLPIPDVLKSYLNLPELDDLVEVYDEVVAVLARTKFT